MKKRSFIKLKSLRARLYLLALVPATLIIVLNFYSYRTIKALSENLVEMADRHAPLIQAAAEMDSSLNALLRTLYTISQGDGDSLNKDDLALLESELRNFEAAQKKYLAMPRSDRELELYAPVAENWQTVGGIINQVVKMSKEINITSGEERGNFVNRIRPALPPIISAVGAISTSLLQAGVNRQTEIHERTTRQEVRAKHDRQLTIILGIVGALGSLIGGIAIARASQRSLIAITARVANSSDHVNDASTQISVAGQDLAQGSSSSAAAIEETVASLETVMSGVQLTADRAKEASELSNQSKVSAEDGKKHIEGLIGAMKMISASSSKVSEIINIIEEIAFQTNLLALNAAVEAARAGEQGRGFAVVAEAVRALAQRSSDSVKDINSLVQDILEKIRNGSGAADQSGESLKTIVDSTHHVAELVNEISTASQEQSVRIAQVNAAINEIDKSVQRNASIAQETATASLGLTDQARTLEVVVSDLKILVIGDAGNANNDEAARTKPSHSSSAFQDVRARKARRPHKAA